MLAMLAPANSVTLRTHEKERVGVGNTSGGCGASPEDYTREHAYCDEVCIVQANKVARRSIEGYPT